MACNSLLPPVQPTRFRRILGLFPTRPRVVRVFWDKYAFKVPGGGFQQREGVLVLAPCIVCGTNLFHGVSLLTPQLAVLPTGAAQYITLRLTRRIMHTALSHCMRPLCLGSVLVRACIMYTLPRLVTFTGCFAWNGKRCLL